MRELFAVAGGEISSDDRNYKVFERTLGKI